MPNDQEVNSRIWGLLTGKSDYDPAKPLWEKKKQRGDITLPKKGVGPSRDFLGKIGLGEGLIDLPTDELFLRQKRTNPDQTIASHKIGPVTGYSSARSFSRGFSDDTGRTKEILMPQVVNGFVLTPDDATKWMQKTGKHFGTYDTPEHADYAGQRLHEVEELHDDLLKAGVSHKRKYAY